MNQSNRKQSFISLTLSVSLLFIVNLMASCGSEKNPNNASKDLNDPATTTVISIELPPSHSLALNYSDTLDHHLSFLNQSSHDSIITRHCKINQPTVFIRGYNLKIDGKYKITADTIMLLPGDSLFMDKNFKIKYATHLPFYIDSCISVTPGTNPLDLNASKNSIIINYAENNKKIEGLAIESTAKEALKTLNLNLKYEHLYTLFEKIPIGPTESLFIDSLNESLLRDESKLSMINARLRPFYSATLISAKIHGATSNNFWEYFTLADKKIKQSKSYRDYTVTLLQKNFIQNFDSRGNVPYLPGIPAIIKTLETIDKQAIPDEFKDSVLKLAKILWLTKSDYKKAKAELSDFYNGKYLYFFNNELQSNHETKNISAIPNVELLDFAGKKHKLIDVVSDSKFKITFIDFWASWCLPCMREIPILKSIEKEMENQPIKFVSISIDHKEDTEEWIKKAKEKGIYKEPYQYRLIDYPNSPLTSLFQLNSIPRFLIIDSDGKVLDDHAYRPIPRKLKAELTSYLATD